MKAWLIRSTQNAIVHHLRKKKVKGEIFVDTTFTEQGNILVEESLELYEERRDKRELAGRIFREVRAVNEQWFEVLVMYCLEGLSYAEAAKRLHISESVLRARMYRARTYIKEKFGQEYLDR